MIKKKKRPKAGSGLPRWDPGGKRPKERAKMDGGGPKRGENIKREIEPFGFV